MQIAIIQYNAGNTRSLQYALDRLGVTSMITSDPETIQTADKVIFPGVGAARAAMSSLHQTKLSHLIPTLRQPVLGICLGMQLLCNHSEEDETPCLGIIDTTVKRFQGNGKVPQIGWNQIHPLEHLMLRNVPTGSHVYYVHSYYVPVDIWTIARTHYMLTYSAAIQKSNFYGVQFHPEKSGDTGAKILSNFLAL